MCGIVGTVGFPDDAEAQIQALSLIKHRGPDDDGIWKDDTVFFGHVRLSILDTSELGHQPMVSSDGKYILIFNGEIYNHLDLRKELLCLGYSFRSTSDTETLSVGLIQWGVDVIPRLNGIFAFAFYDIQRRKVIIARDHFGVKPLYYILRNKAIAFGSESKAILPFCGSLTIQPKNLSNYVSLLWSPGEVTPVEEIKKLLPGYYLQIEFGDGDPDLTFVRYYEIPFMGRYRFNDEKETVDRLDEKICEAVRKQLLSDVPVGFFLSGGLDSSLLVAIARKLKSEKLQCFTIDTDVDSQEEGFQNDLHYAKNVASHLDVNLEVVKADINIVRDFDFMIWHLDEPQADAAPLNVSNISNRAREMGYKVLIGGTAGDDLFSGYRRHQAVQLERWFSLFPSSVLSLISKLRLPNRSSLLRRINKIIRELAKEPAQRLANYYLWLPEERVQRLFKPEEQSCTGYKSTDYLLDLLNDIPKEDSWLNRMLYWEMRSFLVDHNLNYTDKMGMAHGVEIRVPFLDLELVQFTTEIPPELKLRGKETKYILKKVAERYLPNEVIYRSKTGFGAPVRKWVLNDLNDLIAERLLTESKYNSVFNLKEVEKLVNDNRARKIDASYSIWGLLAIESWIRQFMFKN